jgi:hypothetical protein
MYLEEISIMSPEPIEHDRFSLPVPPGYEQCAASPASPRADFVASPLAMAALFDWEDEEDDEY